MATNRVEISPTNIPGWQPHEPVLHAFTNLRLQLTWGTGFPGSGGVIDLVGTVHLSVFRLVFVPNEPTREFFSFVMPLSCLSQFKPEYEAPKTTSGLGSGISNFFKSLSSSPASAYEISDDAAPQKRLKKLKMVLRPMVNERTDPIGLAMVLAGIPVIPTAPIVATGVVTTVAEAILTPNHGEESRCLLHRGTLMSGAPSCPLAALVDALIPAAAAAARALAPGAASNAVLALGHLAALQTPQHFGEYEYACSALRLPTATAPAEGEVFPPGEAPIPFPASAGGRSGSAPPDQYTPPRGGRGGGAPRPPARGGGAGAAGAGAEAGGVRRRTWQEEEAAEQRAREQRQQMRDEHFRRLAQQQLQQQQQQQQGQHQGQQHHDYDNVSKYGSINDSSSSSSSTTGNNATRVSTSATTSTATTAAAADAAFTATAHAYPPAPRSGSPAPPPYTATVPPLGPRAIAMPNLDVSRRQPVQADLFGADYDANAAAAGRLEVDWAGEVRRVPSPVPLPAPAPAGSAEEARGEAKREVAAAEEAAEGGKGGGNVQPHTVKETFEAAVDYTEGAMKAVVHGVGVDNDTVALPAYTPPQEEEEEEDEGVPSAVSL